MAGGTAGNRALKLVRCHETRLKRVPKNRRETLNTLSACSFQKPEKRRCAALRAADAAGAPTKGRCSSPLCATPKRARGLKRDAEAERKRKVPAQAGLEECLNATSEGCEPIPGPGRGLNAMKGFMFYTDWLNQQKFHRAKS